MAEKLQVMCLLLSLKKSDMSWSIWLLSEIKITGSKGSRTNEYCQGSNSCWLQLSRGVKGAGTGTQTVILVKGKYLAGAKVAYGSAPGCTAAVTDKVLSWLSNRPFSRNKYCWGEMGPTWKRGARVSLPTVQNLTCRHLQWDLMLGLTLLQHSFQCLGYPWSLDNLNLSEITIC